MRSAATATNRKSIALGAGATFVARTIDVDAICHSRGGLVLRTLIEHLLPGSGLDLAVQRAIFVAATNQGTELARPDNWEPGLGYQQGLVAVPAGGRGSGCVR